jgi:lysophospholipase L1-like esterase
MTDAVFPSPPRYAMEQRGQSRQNSADLGAIRNVFMTGCGHVPAAKRSLPTGRKMKPIAICILFMGDSITAGQYVDPQLRWTSLVGDALVRKYHDTSVNLLCLNRGISGETTRQGLERYPTDVQSIHPDVMTLQFGLNDCNSWVTDRGMPRVTLPAYRANIMEMIQRARLFGAKEIILSTNHPTLRRKILLSGESLEDARKRYNETVRKVAHETGVTLCDMEKAFDGLADQQLELELLPYPDHLHLSAPGHVRYAGTIGPLVKRAVERIIEGSRA